MANGASLRLCGPVSCGSRGRDDPARPIRDRGVGLLLADHYRWWLIVIVASAGNTLGSVVNWFLGRYIAHFEDRRWFPVSKAMILRTERWYRHYGQWSLLLSWLPLIGDPLTVVAGVLREPLPMFVLLVAIAKTARYLAVVAITFGWM